MTTIRIPVELISTGGSVDQSLIRAADRAGESAGQAFSRAFEQRTSNLGNAIDPSALGGSGAFEQAGETGGEGLLGGLTGSLKGAGPAAIAGVALALGAVAGKVLSDALGEAINLEAATGKVAASLGGTVEDAKEFGEIASNLYADAWGESLTEVTDAVGAVKSAFRGLSGAELQAATEDAIAFSTIFDQDIPTAVNAAQVAVKQGLARDVTEAFDLLTAASQKVPVALRGDVLDAVEEYSIFFNQLGIEGPQAFGALASSAELGQFGIDKTGDAIKEFTIRATDGSAASVKAFDDIGVNAQRVSNLIIGGGEGAGVAFDEIVKGILSIKDPSKQAQTAIALFGTPLEDLGTKNIPEFLRALAQGDDALGNFEGATDRASAVLNENAATAWTEFKRTVEITFVNFMGEEVVPLLLDVIGHIQRFADAFRGIGSGGTELPAASKEIRDTWIEIQETFAIYIEFVTEMWDLFGDDIKKLASTSFKETITIIRGAFQIVRGIFQVFTGLIRGDWSLVWDGIKNITRGANKIVLATIRRTFGFVRAAFTAFGKVWIAVYTGIWEGIKDLTDKGVEAILDGIKGIPGKIREVNSALFQAGKDLVGAIFSGIRSAVSAGGSLVGDLVSQIKSAINSALGLPLRIDFDKGPIHIHETIIPAFADGVRNFRGGLALVGEEGPELVELPRGSNVIPSGEIGRTERQSVDSTVRVNNNFFGPTTSGGRLQELEWTLRYATGARRETVEGVPA